MSVSFYIKGHPVDHEGSLNLDNGNAASLLEYLGYFEYAYDLQGEIPARDLRIRCGLALHRPEGDALDAGREALQAQGDQGAWHIQAPRRPGYLRYRIKELLKLIDAAGDLGVIRFD